MKGGYGVFVVSVIVFLFCYSEIVDIFCCLDGVGGLAAYCG